MTSNHPSPVDLVLEFHRTYGQAIRHEPVLDVPERKMRVALVVEEMDEYREAEGNDDLVEVADALGDLIYVAVGAAITHGFVIPEDYLDIRHHGLLPNGPRVPTMDAPERKLWLERVQGRVNDYAAAEAAGDFAEAQRSIAGIVCLAYGAARAHGIDLDAVLEEIQASNMSKLDEDGNPIYREDGKVLKGKNFFSPNIQRVLDEQQVLTSAI